MFRGAEIPFNDFSGGMASNISITQLKNNQALELDNVIVFPAGKGFRARLGDTAFNGTAMGAPANVQGLDYYKQADQDEWLVAIAGTAVFKSEMDGTMDTITGAVTITAGQDNIWSFVTFNDNVVAFGGPANSPDAPIRWTGAGNAAALGGSPPSAYGAFQANNRVFAFRTAAAPSTIYWSIVGNEADWTGSGSGSADVWESDNDRLTAAAVLSTNTVLLFKENSIHQMQIGATINSAFPIFPLFSGVGCAGKHACVTANGKAYFITSQGKMRITDGQNLITDRELPALANMDDEWNEIPVSRLPYVQGIRKTGIDYDHIIWCVSSGSGASANNRALIWDLTNQCWLRNTKGFDCNVMAVTQDGTLYGGHTDGKIYKKEVALTHTDASESSAVIDAYWTSGQISNDKIESIKQVRKINLTFETQTNGGNIRISHGFDFNGVGTTQTVDQTTVGDLWGTGLWGVMEWGGSVAAIKSVRTFGRGNVFQYRVRSPLVAVPFRIYGLSLSGKEAGQKEFAAR